MSTRYRCSLPIANCPLPVLPSHAPTHMASPRSPLLWALSALAAATALGGAAQALLSGDPLRVALWVLGPLGGAALLGWLPGHAGLLWTRRRLRWRFGDPIPPLLRAPAEEVARGLGLGVAAACVWEALVAFTEDNLVVLALFAGLGALALISAALGHGRLRQLRRRQLRPWKILRRLQALHDLADPAPVAAAFVALRRAAAEMPESAQSRAIEERARPLLLGLRDHAVTRLTDLAAQGRGAEALAALNRWRESPPECAPLLEFLQLSPERLTALQRELETRSAQAWAERRAALEPLLAEAAALLQEGQPAAAAERADAVLVQITGEGELALADLRARAASLCARARAIVEEAHRAAVVISREEAAIEQDAEAVRQALLYTRQHLDGGDLASAAGWLAEAERLVGKVPDPEGTGLRLVIEELRPRCAERPTRCPKCQAGLPAGARFCPACGAAVLAPPPADAGIGTPTPTAPEVSVPLLPGAAGPARGRSWHDALVAAGGLLMVAGFFLPWQRPTVPGGPGLSWRNLPSLLQETGLVGVEMDLLFRLARQVEVTVLVLLLGVGVLGAVLGLLLLASPSLPRRGLYLAMRTGCAVGWLGVFSLVSQAAASEAGVLPALVRADLGLGLMALGLPVLTVAAFARRLKARPLL